MNTAQKVLAGILALQVVVLCAIFVGREKVRLEPPTTQNGSVRDFEEFRKGLNLKAADDWLRLAELYRAYGILHLADACYYQAHRRSPKDAEYLYLWGVTRSRMGDFSAAEKLLGMAIRRGIQSIEECQWILAKDKLRQDLPAEAEPLLRQLSKRPDAALLLARLLQRTGRAKEASDVASAALELGDDVRFLQQKSWAEAERGNHALSEAARLKSLVSRRWTSVRDPVYAKDEEIRQRFGPEKDATEARQLRASGKFEEAKKHFLSVLASRWRENEAFELAQLLFETSSPGEALKVLSDYSGRVCESGEVLEMMARASLQAGDKPKAFEFARRAYELKASRSVPATLSIHRLMAEYHRSQGNESAARRQMAELSFELGKQALSEDPSAALRSFAQATVFDPDFANAWFYVGQCRELIGNRSEARSAYQKCLTSNPEHGRALQALRRTE